MEPAADSLGADTLSRRHAIQAIGATGIALMLGGIDIDTAQPGSKLMTVTCVIKYQLDPFQLDSFAEYHATGDASFQNAVGT